jgi:CheY-like chemotaxis protein
MEDNKNLKHVLIVDDEPDLITILGVILKKTGRYRASGASNGKKALEFLSQDASIDLVLTDIRMPQMDGIELMEKIKEINLESPLVMFITGLTDFSIDKVYDAGACGFISKPFDWAQIIAAVDDALKPKPFCNRPYKEEDIKINIESEDFELGRGGVLVTSPQLAEVGDLVRFNIEFKEGEFKKIEGIGEVIWQRKLKQGINSFGIKFFNLNPEIETLLYKFCNKNRVKAFIPMR